MVGQPEDCHAQVAQPWRRRAASAAGAGHPGRRSVGRGTGRGAEEEINPASIPLLRLIPLAGSSFFALLKKRVLLVHVPDVVADRFLRPWSRLLDLFCEPFPEACGLFLLISLPSIAQATVAPSSTASWPAEYQSASATSVTPAATALSCSFCPADLDRMAKKPSRRDKSRLTNHLFGFFWMFIQMSHELEEIKITGVKIFLDPYLEPDEEEVKAQEEAKLADYENARVTGSVGVGSGIGKYLNARTSVTADSAGKEGAESDKSTKKRKVDVSSVEFKNFSGW
ncbi:peptidyl-prolyl cis-trans isomerase CYP65 [Canna indica]|uniref:Peptidyl-prolyl cis-trans isomerase CYP65 n=1 Tax=Canna indica TaxID=4628 RepID=A0AAQ3JZ07_9LILI|nr:peptidyl-prolyl cis-trans isomerase CYP65 [Canna indica]